MLAKHYKKKKKKKKKKNGPAHNISYKVAYAPSKDSDQPANSHSLFTIRNPSVHSQGSHHENMSL